MENYWKMAGFSTITTVRKNAAKIVTDYQKLMKDKSETNDRCIAARDKFLEEAYTLFDVAQPDLEVLLSQNRILGNVGGTSQDRAFYHDQKGARLGHMGKVDTRVGRKLKNLSDFLCHGDVNIGYRIIPTSEIASSLRCPL